MRYIVENAMKKEGIEIIDIVYDIEDLKRLNIVLDERKLDPYNGTVLFKTDNTIFDSKVTSIMKDLLSCELGSEVEYMTDEELEDYVYDNYKRLYLENK